jgi:hypothetical protein
MTAPPAINNAKPIRCHIRGRLVDFRMGERFWWRRNDSNLLYADLASGSGSPLHAVSKDPNQTEA